jgi:DNA-binding Xre family transcriptional regulator
MQLKQSCRNKALAALDRSNYNGQKGLSQALSIAQSTVSQFLKCKSIRPQIFQDICEKLNLDFQEVAEDIDGSTGGQYIARAEEKFACKRLEERSALIRIVAPSGFGKSTLMWRLLDYAESLEHQYIYANLDKIIVSGLEGQELNLQGLLRKLICEIGASIDRSPVDMENNLSEYDRRVELFGCANAYLWYLKNLQSQGESLTLAISKLDRLLDYPEIAKEFFSLLRSMNEKTKVSKDWHNFRLILSYSTPHIESLIPIDINSSPFNVGVTIELNEFSVAESKELFGNHNLLLTALQISQLREWIGNIPSLLSLTIDKMKVDGIVSIIDVMIAGDWDKILALYSKHLESMKRCLEVEELFSTMVNVAQSPQPTLNLPLLTRCRLHRRGSIEFTDRDGIEPRCRLYREYFGSFDETR